jgi:hypothetical protein
VGRTFNNRPLPSDDYWYIKLEDGREAKGHRPSSDNQFAKQNHLTFIMNILQKVKHYLGHILSNKP